MNMYESEIEEEGTDIAEEESTSEEKPWDAKRIRVDSKVFSINQLLDMIDNKELDLSPDFQRLQVWDAVQKSQLIESLLLRIPIPTFYFSSDMEANMQVVDGVQRLSAIHDFCRGKKYKLSGLEYLGDELKGKSYDDIKNELWGKRLNQTQLQVNVIDPQTPEEVKFDIFRRINTGGTPLNAQEIRHCLSNTRVREFLQKLAGNEFFIKATNEKLLNHKRMSDREFSLRFCAFRLRRDGDFVYGKSGFDDRFLDMANSFIGDKKSCSDQKLAELEKNFDTAMKNAYSIFQRNAFRKKSDTPLNKALFDSLSVELSFCDPVSVEKNAATIKQKFNELISDDEDFEKAISLSTGEKKKVEYRFEAIGKVLEAYKS